MIGKSAMQFVGGQMDRAWLDLRVQLADRHAAVLATGDMEPIRALGHQTFRAGPGRGEAA